MFYEMNKSITTKKENKEGQKQHVLANICTV